MNPSLLLITGMMAFGGSAPADTAKQCYVQFRFMQGDSKLAAGMFVTSTYNGRWEEGTSEGYLTQQCAGNSRTLSNTQLFSGIAVDHHRVGNEVEFEITRFDVVEPGADSLNSSTAACVPRAPHQVVTAHLHATAIVSVGAELQRIDLGSGYILMVGIRDVPR
jgi:hypothetical protein